jgi:SAM-dependent methyltransferase
MSRAQHEGPLTEDMRSSYQQVVAGDPFYEKDLRQMACAVNYLTWQFDQIRPFLRGHVLEVGGGIGNFTTRISAVATQVTSLEPNHNCFVMLRDAVRNCSNVRLLESMVEEVPVKLGSEVRFETIVCMNVLEHIQDDGAVAVLFARLLTPGGRLVLMVPAVAWAYGEIDRRLGHFRRYSKRSVKLLLENAGLQAVALHYTNIVGLAGWLWNARVGKRTSQDDGQIAVFDRFVVPVVSRLESMVHPPVGQSLIVAATTRTP